MAIKRWNNPGVPEEIIEEQILIRLPVKSLVRFRSVCKSWKAIILSSRFIKSHLTRSHLKPNSDTLLVYKIPTSTINGQGMEIARVSRIFGHNCVYIHRRRVKLDSFSTTVSMHTSRVTLFGSVNGLVGIYCPEKLRFCGVPYSVVRFWLWNPATQQFKVVPILRTDEISELVHVQVGLGFDSDANDFKFVCVFKSKFASQRLARCHVYSSKCNSWNNITETACFDKAANIGANTTCVISPYQSTIVNGCPYWDYNTNENNGSVVLAFYMFDVKNEMFRPLPKLRFPSGGIYYTSTKWNAVNFKDSLCTLVYHHLHGGISVDLHSFDKRGRLWCMVYSARRLEFGLPERNVYSIMFKQCFKNGEIVFSDYGGNEFVYRLETDVTMRLGPHESCSFEKSLNYTESLAFVEGMELMTKDNKLGYFI